LAFRFCSVPGVFGGTWDGEGKFGLFWERCSGLGVDDCSWDWGFGMFKGLGEEMFREVGMFVFWASLLSTALSSIGSSDGVLSEFYVLYLIRINL
jgi:hypothetical protein